MTDPQDSHLSALEEAMTGLVASHETLLDLTTRHRAAMARADTDALTRIIEAQEAELRIVARLEAQRRAAVRALVGGVARKAPEPPLAQALAKVADPLRDRVAQLAERLRGLVGRLIRERDVVRQATVSLVGHMEGLMRQVAQSLSQSGAYARSGQVEAPQQPIVTGLDVTT